MNPPKQAPCKRRSARVAGFEVPSMARLQGPQMIPASKGGDGEISIKHFSRSTWQPLGPVLKVKLLLGILR